MERISPLINNHDKKTHQVIFNHFTDEFKTSQYSSDNPFVNTHTTIVDLPGSEIPQVEKFMRFLKEKMDIYTDDKGLAEYLSTIYKEQLADSPILGEDDKDIAIAIDNSKQTYLAEEMQKWKINKQMEQDEIMARELQNEFITEQQLTFDECLKQINFNLSHTDQQVVDEFKNHWYLIEQETPKCNTKFKIDLNNEKKRKHIERFSNWLAGKKITK